MQGQTTGASRCWRWGLHSVWHCRPLSILGLRSDRAAHVSRPPNGPTSRWAMVCMTGGARGRAPDRSCAELLTKGFHFGGAQPALALVGAGAIRELSGSVTLTNPVYRFPPQCLRRSCDVGEFLLASFSMRAIDGWRASRQLPRFSGLAAETSSLSSGEDRTFGDTHVRTHVRRHPRSPTLASSCSPCMDRQQGTGTRLAGPPIRLLPVAMGLREVALVGFAAYHRASRSVAEGWDVWRSPADCHAAGGCRCACPTTGTRATGRPMPRRR